MQTSDLEKQFNLYLDYMIYYLCSRCSHPPPQETPQFVPPGSGMHMHNGEILKHIGAYSVSADRILSSFNTFLSEKNKSKIEKVLAESYNEPQLHLFENDGFANAIRLICKYRNAVWIRHGIEFPNRALYLPDEIYPPKHTRFNIGELGQKDNDDKLFFAIDLEQFPFTQCSQHKLEIKDAAPWNQLAGYLPIEIFNGVFTQPSDRDHFYAKGTNLTSEWLFVAHTDFFKGNHAESLKRNQDIILEKNLSYCHFNTCKKLNAMLILLNNVISVKKHIAKMP